jgi:hypothetical protein
LLSDSTSVAGRVSGTVLVLALFWQPQAASIAATAKANANVRSLRILIVILLLECRVHDSSRVYRATRDLQPDLRAIRARAATSPA